MLQSLSVNGFREALIECTKRYHLRLSAQWRSYVDSLTTHKSSTRYLFFTPAEQLNELKQQFYECSSKLYDQPVPSAAYLISRVIILMESEANYWNKKMQLIDGRHLSGDHSFKLTKCILSNKTKPFTAMYTLMNEYGQVAGWWFTTGTGMNELEESFKKLKQ
eukprot:scaffold139138_cov23-Cyclotella_meneghiniana.AAC.1